MFYNKHDHTKARRLVTAFGYLYFKGIQHPRLLGRIMAHVTNLEGEYRRQRTEASLARTEASLWREQAIALGWEPEDERPDTSHELRENALLEGVK